MPRIGLFPRNVATLVAAAALLSPTAFAQAACAPTGECEGTVAPGAAQAPGAQPGYGTSPAAVAQPDAQQLNLTVPEPPPAEQPTPEIGTFSFVPRIGMQLLGTGRLEDSCDGNGCQGIASSSIDANLKSAIAVGADFMFRVSELIRIGPGLLHTFTMDREETMRGKSYSRELGSITDMNLVFELIPRAYRTIWLVPRFQVGATMFNASGDAKSLERSNETSCNQEYRGMLGGCDSFKSPHFGFNVGLGLGAVFAVGPSVRLRADALYQYYNIGLAEVDAVGVNATLNETATGSRSFLLFGVEI